MTHLPDPDVIELRLKGGWPLPPGMSEPAEGDKLLLAVEVELDGVKQATKKGVVIRQWSADCVGMTDAVTDIADQLISGIRTEQERQAQINDNRQQIDGQTWVDPDTGEISGDED